MADTIYKQRNLFWKARTVLLSLVVLFIAIFLTNRLTVHFTENPQPNNNYKAPRVAVIQVTDTGFEPSTITVEQGTTVIWTNNSNNLHQVAANPYPGGGSLPGLKSQILNNAQTYKYTANTTGTFGYHDQLKPTANGTLLVRKK